MCSCLCCSRCCAVFAPIGAIVLLIFTALIATDNITFFLQFSEKLAEEEKAVKDPQHCVPFSCAKDGNYKSYCLEDGCVSYKEFRNTKVKACLIGAGIYGGIFALSLASLVLGIGRKKR
eukprot:TRINITY_DN98166_c0_g1_i1.p1 TRINITY_DN98166_c0_g1~~TRINITY_DN98166_c0_g1_i1.p1  ORF type:complete len:119 (+),score=17.04 TRINITY_DN98166_c0_g1_i1:41-397(+)